MSGAGTGHRPRVGPSLAGAPGETHLPRPDLHQREAVAFHPSQDPDSLLTLGAEGRGRRRGGASGTSWASAPALGERGTQSWGGGPQGNNREFQVGLSARTLEGRAGRPWGTPAKVCLETSAKSS